MSQVDHFHYHADERGAPVEYPSKPEECPQCKDADLTPFERIMDTLHEAEMGARMWSGDRLREASRRLVDLAATFPPPDDDLT